MTQSQSPSEQLTPAEWLDPRFPARFIAQGMLLYVCITTLGQILWRYFISHEANTVLPRELLERVLANAIGGIVVVTLFWYREKRRVSAASKS